MDDTLGIGVKIDIQDAERALNVFIDQLGKVGIVSNDTQNKLTQTFTELSKSSQSEIAGKTAKALEIMRKAIDEANASIASMPDKMGEAKKNVEKIEKVCAKLDAQLHKLEKKRELLPTNGKEFKELTAKMVGLRSQLSENNVSLKSAREEVLMLSQSYEQAKKSLAGLEEMQSKLETGTLSTADITSMLEKAKQGAGQATIEVDKLSDSSERASLSVGKLLGTFGGMVALKQLGNEIIRVRGEFQQADVAIQTMLGSKQKADALLSEVRQYASISPLEFGDITRATQMMLGFNIEAEKVPEYIRAIGDISMGEGEKFMSLTLAFSQMSATGKLMGQDLMQMINAGFNPLQVIAEQTGKSIEQLKEEMSDGAISAEMVQNAFIKAASAGGKFYKMSENASKTINGQLSMMQDAIDSALNNVGTASENIIISGISGITSLIENYEKVGRVLEGLVLTYGAYRTAVALVTFAENGHTLAMTIARAQILLTQKAQALLNATMLANPYVLAATALGALVGTLVATTDGLSGAERAQRNFNSSLEEAKEKQKKYREETDNAIEAANNDKTATDKRREAMNLLIARYPDIIQKYIDETGHLKDILQLKREIAAIDGQTTVEELNKKSLNYAYNASVMRRSVNAQLSADRTLSERDRAEVQRIKDLYFKETGGNWWDKATTSNREIMEYFEKQSRLNQNQAQRAHTSNSIAAFQDVLAGMDKNKLAIVQEQIQRGHVGRLYPELKGANLTKEDLSGLSTYVSGLLQAKQNAKVDKRALEKQKEEAQNALEALSVEAAAGAEGLKLRQKIAAIDKQLESYSASYGKSKGRGTKDNDPSKITELRNAQDVSRQRAAIDLSFSTREAEIKKQAEGTDKMLAQIELDKDREIEAIRRAYEDMRIARVDEAKKLWDADSKNKGKDFYKSDAFKKANVNTEAEDANRAAREESAIKDYEEKQKAVEERLVHQYQSYTDERLAIDKKYRDDVKSIYAAIAAAEQRGDTDRVEALHRSLIKAAKVRNDEQANLSLRQLKESPEFIRAFEDLGNTSSETLNLLISDFERAKDAAAKSLDPEKLREYTNTLQQMYDELNSRNPFESFAKSAKEMKKAQDELSSAQNILQRVKNGEIVIRSVTFDEKTKRFNVTQWDEESASRAVAAAKDAEAKAYNKVLKAITACSQQLTNFGSAMEQLGNSIGGTAGDIFGVVGGMANSIGSVMGSLQNINVNATGLSAVLQKVSVVGTAISAMIDMNAKLDSILPDTQSLYEHYAAKQREINVMQQNIMELQIDQLEDRLNKEHWIYENGLTNLRKGAELNKEYLETYGKIAAQPQEIYQNAGSGFSKWAPAIIGAIVGIVAGVLTFGAGAGPGAALGAAIGSAIGGTAIGAALGATTVALIGTAIFSGVGAALGNAVRAGIDGITYDEGQTAAINNMRVQTRHKTFFRSEKTQDLESWVRENWGEELFEEVKGVRLIDPEVARKILEDGPTLVGETRETLEKLTEYSEKIHEFLDDIHEQVSQSFSPLVDNLTDALWDWLNEGKDVMDSFREYASDTFKDIAKDALKAMASRLIFEPFQEQLEDMTIAYATKQIDETAYMLGVSAFAKEAQTAIENYLPSLENAVETIQMAFDNAGIDITDKDVYQQKGSTGAWESLGEDTGRELNGRFTALQITGESLLEVGTEINQQLSFIGQDVSETRISVGEISANIREIVGAQNAANEYLSKIETNTRVLPEMRDQLTDIQRHVNNI